jgi:uncharacterized protein YbaR (Trm112 family)
MQVETLEILRCPYCGGRLELVDSLFHRRTDDEIQDGILGCHCCIFPVVDGIPVLHLQPNATAARDHVQAGRPDLARRTMVGLEDAREAEAFEAIAASAAATYRDIVEALGPNFEGGYFLYRFSDPTYIVAQAVVRAVATTVLYSTRRAIDICGGSGHLTRSLVDLSSPPPVLADLYYAKVWLARRFTAPGCEPVCCDGNAPFPFARGAFGFAMCTDAFMYIWTKRQFVGEMERLIDNATINAEAAEHAETHGSASSASSALTGVRGEPGAILIGHTHNERTWSPSHGQPLSPAGYRDLFETFEPRVFGEASLFADVVKGGPLDLSRREPDEVLDRDPALTIIASPHPDVFAAHPIEAPPAAATGEFRVNPLYAAHPDGSHVRLRLQFPSEDYELEYGACRTYLPEEIAVDRETLARLPAASAAGPLADLARKRVILDLPKKYY